MTQGLEKNLPDRRGSLSRQPTGAHRRILRLAAINPGNARALAGLDMYCHPLVFSLAGRHFFPYVRALSSLRDKGS